MPPQGEAPPAAELKLERAHLDLRSTRTQMSLAAVLIFITCLASYWQTLTGGFLLDDFLHVDYAARALTGDWADFLGNFAGNWAGSDIMKSYRPLVSVSFFIDYVLWGAHAAGFHLTNILLLFGCSLFVSLATLEISGLYGNRLGAAPAMWAGLLFAVYPLHPEATAWIVGRVDLLCGLFYLGSLWSYMRYRVLRERAYLAGSLTCFLLALLSKEMAATLPAAVALMELLLYSRAAQPAATLVRQPPLKERLVCVGSFFLVLAVYAGLRTALLGTMVGGYGQSGLKELLYSLKVFADRASMAKILVPLNEEVAAGRWAARLAPAVSALAAAALAVRLVLRSTPPGAPLLLLALIPLMVLPTFQIWHIYPNLVGSRLFFLSSAPFCILLALAALPFGDTMARRSARRLAASGLAMLAALFASWSYLLQANLKPWLEASRQMRDLGSQIGQIATAVPEGKQVLLLNLPRDFSGAGMLTRPQYLDILARPPFSTETLSGRLVTVEPIVSGSHEYLWPRRLRDILSSDALHGIMIWDSESARFIPWIPDSGESRYSFAADSRSAGKIRLSPQAEILPLADWRVESPGQPVVLEGNGFLRIYPGSTGLTVYFPAVDVHPLGAQIALLDAEGQTADGCTQCLGNKMRLVWSDDDAPRPPARPTGQANVWDRYQGRFLVWLGRYRSWTLAGNVRTLGLSFEPGSYYVDLRGVSIVPDDALLPALRLEGTRDARDLWLRHVSRAKPATLRYDAGNIPGAAWVKVLVTSAGVTFDADSERAVAAAVPAKAHGGLLAEMELSGTAGRFNLPQELLQSPGAHQVRLVAYDRLGLPVGLPSEPVSVFVEKR